nr:MAG TPA: hypothetical protein [Caudoviricetes sp.]
MLSRLAIVLSLFVSSDFSGRPDYFCSVTLVVLELVYLF